MKLRLSLMLVTLAVSATFAPASGATTPDHVVQVGALHPTEPNTSTYNYTRFYPETQQIHRGDTVRWQWAIAGYFGWHTVSFVPGDMDVAAHPNGLESAIPELIRPDETGIALSEELVFGKADAGPSGFVGCGRGAWRNLPADVQPCALTSTDTMLSSSLSDTFLNMPGSPNNITWDVTIDLDPGSYRYRCLIHPTMQGSIEVVPDDQPLPPAEQIAADTAAQIAADTAAADAVVEELGDPANAFDPATGTWTVHAGAETPDGGVSIYSYLPSNLPVSAGDEVEFVAGMAEPNTVTFPPDAHGSFGLEGCTPVKCGKSNDARRELPGAGLAFTAFPFLCDVDDPATGVPGAMLFLTRATWQCAAGDLEWTVAPHMAQAQAAPGNEVLTPATFHNSGWLISEEAPAYYAETRTGWHPRIPARFDATFPTTGSFRYACLAHPDFMTGSITVEG